MTSLITEAVTALRARTAAVPGFSPSLAALLEVCAGDTGEAGKHAQAVAEDILRPRGNGCTCAPRGGVLLSINETCPHHGEE